MPVDPIQSVADEIRSIEQILEDAVLAASLHQSCAQSVCVLEAWLADLRAALVHMRPTSLIGAGALIRIAANGLPATLTHLRSRLDRIGDRLEKGHRDLADIIWLRGTAASLPGDVPARNVARLLENALVVASRPVPVHRSTWPHRRGTDPRPAA